MFDQRGQRVQNQTNVTGNVVTAGGSITVISGGDTSPYSAEDREVMVDVWRDLKRVARALEGDNPEETANKIGEVSACLSQLIMPQTASNPVGFDQTNQTVGIQFQINVAHEQGFPRGSGIRQIINEVDQAKVLIQKGNFVLAKLHVNQAVTMLDEITS
ncbi:MAG: hypothetical protein WCX71_04630 [Candidatus Buchananbacteria bacterium]